MKFINAIKSIPYKSLLFGPSVLYALGFASNKIVMGLNGALMPVLVPGGCPAEAENGILDATHSCMTAATHAKFLADWINVHVGIESIGDIFLDFGEWAFWPALILGIAFLVRDRNVLRQQ